MKTIHLSSDNFDKSKTFNIVYEGFRGQRRTKKCQLRRDYNVRGDGIYWALSSGAVLKDVYTDADRAEYARLSSGLHDIEDGEIVLIDGAQYECMVKGNYSDAAIFKPVI